MASIASSLPTQNPYASIPTAGSSTDSGSQDMFLQLLVAQLQNQDPLNPTDGTAFVTQLAQFQQLETSLSSAQDITAIRTDIDQLVAASPAAGTSASSSDGNNSSSTSTT